MTDLTHLLKFSREITATTDPAKLYRRIIEFVQELLRLDFATLMLLSADKTALTVHDTLGFPESMVGAFQLLQGQGLSTHVVHTGKPETVLNFRAETRFEVPPVVLSSHISSAVCVPMMIEDEVFGVLIGHTLEERTFPEEEITLFQNMGNLGAIAIRNAHSMQALKQSRNEWERTFNAVTDLIMIIDPEYRIVKLNTAMAEMLGLPAEEAVGRTCHRLVQRLAGEADRETGTTPSVCSSGAGTAPDEGTRVCGDCPITELFDSGRITTVERSMPGRSGTRSYEVISTPLKNAAGTVIAGIKIMRDITARKAAEAERLSLEAQLLHTQKLESLGVLAGGIAHDFNNILTAVLGHAELALLRMNPAAPGRENIQEIEASASRAADLARQMLAYSGKGKFTIETLDLNAVVTEMTHMLEVSISKKAVLRYKLQEGLPPVDADATQLRQVIMNLVINASDAIGDRSGTISISTGAMDCDRAYLGEIWLQDNLAEGLYVSLEVADTGCGIDKESVTKIFDPFFTTKFTGRGLGLAAVLGIMRGHRGAIKVYSEAGRGTVFKALFPASAELALSLKQQREQIALHKGGGTVLLVDDEETVRAIAREMLEALGFRTRSATHGREAVELFTKYGADIDCVMLDLTMPHLDGEETFRELRRIRPDVKVIMTSGYCEQEVTQRFIGKGLTAFIQKPFKLASLNDTLRKVLGSDR